VEKGVEVAEIATKFGHGVGDGGEAREFDGPEGVRLPISQSVQS
jgi:hypothetical protein